MASDEEATVYCLCRQPYDETLFMIECDICKDWFHGSCVQIQEHQASDIEIYHCPNCQIAHGPLVLKKRRNWHRHDYSESDENISKAVQTGTVVFVKELKNRTFPSADEIPILRMHGSQLTIPFLEENGFEVPILVDKKDGLNLTVPPPTFSILDVENYVGSMREIDVIDVARQEDYKMVMREWTEYYNSPNRSKIFNVISLEFSQTKLSELVVPPLIIRQLSWVSNLWPDQLPEDCQFTKPEVQKYCLMGVKDSFTDFHIDFGGTSVWYHVLRGEKVFFLIRPTPANITLYERWVSSANQSEMFFGDQVDACYRCVVRQGQTLFIPTGWIHGVLTPIDSLVFGGNFLHSLNIPLQLQIYDIEKRVKTPEKYLFPNFETLHWYSAKQVLDGLVDCKEDNKKPPVHLVTGAKALVLSLKSWTQKKELNTKFIYSKANKDAVPETIQYGRLLKDLNRELKHLQKPSKEKLKQNITDSKPKKQKKKKTTGKDIHDLELLHQHTTEKLQELQQQMKEDGGKPKVKVKQSKKEGKQKKKEESKPVIPEKDPYEFDDDSKPATPVSITHPLKMRIPKAGAYMDSLKELKEEHPETPSPGIKLKVSNGKIISGGSSDGGTPGKFQSLTKLKSESDDEDAPLVVDETPQRKSKSSKKKSAENTSSTTLKPGSLKLKLSIHNNPNTPAKIEAVPKPVKEEKVIIKPVPTLSVKTSPVSAADKPSAEAVSPEVTSVGKQASEDNDVDSLDRTDMPMIRGGLNGSIADILEASGYGTETDFKIDENLGAAASPSMRDAIQGMLSMSQMGGVPWSQPASTLTLDSPKSSKSKPAIKLQRGRRMYEDDAGEKMPTCYKDDEFVYPTLEASDTEEDYVFKPRGRQKKDETWNPKAKLQPNCPKPERPIREGVKKEAVESGLAAAAKHLANMPRPKRQYIKKKPKADKLLPSSLSSPFLSSSFSSSLPDSDPVEGSVDSLSLSAPASSLNIALPGTSDSDMPPIGSKRPAEKSSPLKAKRPKKGQATAKQRLGKILKIHKMVY